MNNNEIILELKRKLRRNKLERYHLLNIIYNILKIFNINNTQKGFIVPTLKDISNSLYFEICNNCDYASFKYTEISYNIKREFDINKKIYHNKIWFEFNIKNEDGNNTIQAIDYLYNNLIVDELDNDYYPNIDDSIYRIDFNTGIVSIESGYLLKYVYGYDNDEISDIYLINKINKY